MSYPGDPAGGQQNYPYSDAYGQPQPAGYPQQPPAGPNPPVSGGFGAPPPPSGPPASGPPAGYTPDAPYGGGYGYDPAQASGPPVSASPYSTPPAMTAPMAAVPGGPAPSSGTRRGPIVPILAAALGLFVLIAGVFTILYITKNGAYNDQKQVAAERQTSIDGLTADNNKLKEDLKKTQDDLEAAKRDLGGAQGQADELKRQKQVISKCITLIGEAGDAAERGDTATAQAKRTEATPVCEEAGRYLD